MAKKRNLPISDILPVFVVPAFYPDRANAISAADQMQDLIDNLSVEFQHIIVVNPFAKGPTLTRGNNVTYIRPAFFPSAPRSRYYLRGLTEFINSIYSGVKTSFYLTGNIQKRIIFFTYSPSLMCGLTSIIGGIGKDCHRILLLRDITPRWLVDLNIIRSSSVSYYVLRLIERLIYRFHSPILCQHRSNLDMLRDSNPKVSNKFSVLENWLSGSYEYPTNIDSRRTVTAAGITIIYAGNIGLAQNIQENIIDLAKGFLQIDKSAKFIFVGGGNEASKLSSHVVTEGVGSLFEFREAVPRRVIPTLYRQASFGLLMLDSRHTTHNIPGKYLGYLRAGLPVLAFLNVGNPLKDEINLNGLGVAVESRETFNSSHFQRNVVKFLNINNTDRRRIMDFAERNYSTENAVNSLLNAMKGHF